ncbi:MAG: glycosyltransferase [Epulopiscium sp.]|nr:glycosyltransferase [Candidatus Epulonipiscium sp.]
METNYSVLMSVYKKEKPEYFIESIESMLKQTVKPEQIVIVKDGPLTEKLDNVVDKYKELFPNIFTVVPLDKNLGLGLALNEGLKKCRNELVARMDTDDISLERRCELQLSEFTKDTKLSICGTMIDEFFNTPDNIVTSRIVPENHDEILKFSRRRSPFNHVTVMFKKEDVLSTDGGYRDILRKEDIDLFIRMLTRGFKGKNINQSLVLVRSDEGYYRRRKSWLNCKGYIKAIYESWKLGHSKTVDLLFVVLTQMGMFLAPVWLLKTVSDKFLRTKKN